MTANHFTTACLKAIHLLGISPAQFGAEVGLTRLGIAVFEGGQPLPLEVYRPAFKFFLRDPKTALYALDLARGCMVDSLLQCGLDEGTIEDLQAKIGSNAAVAHMFGQLPIPYLVAMSVIGNAASKNAVVHNTLFGLAELCRAIAEDRNVPRGFFSQHWKPSPSQRVLLGGSLGELVARIHTISPEE